MKSQSFFGSRRYTNQPGGGSIMTNEEDSDQRQWNKQGVAWLGEAFKTDFRSNPAIVAAGKITVPQLDESQYAAYLNRLEKEIRSKAMPRDFMEKQAK